MEVGPVEREDLAVDLEDERRDPVVFRFVLNEVLRVVPWPEMERVLWQHESVLWGRSVVCGGSCATCLLRLEPTGNLEHLVLVVREVLVVDPEDVRRDPGQNRRVPREVLRNVFWP